MERIKVFEAFAGYGSQAMALKRLQEEHPADLSFEFVGISEIEPNAIKAYNAVHGETVNFGDISKIDWEGGQVPNFDLFTYSFPCQDISNAGKQKGLTEGSGSRSSLLWECRRAIEAKKPKYLLMENVKNLVSDKFSKDFAIWVQWLYEQGYQNFYEVLNAKDYGVPQNRERVFMISIRDDSDDPFDKPTYVFPKPFKLECRLKDLLETDVPESYYLKEEQVRKIVEDCDSDVAKGCGFTKEETEGVIQVGNLIPDDGRKFSNPFIGRVYSKEGVSPTLLTMQGGNREPKVLIPINTTGKESVSGCITAHYHKAGWADLNPMCQLPHPAVAEISAEPLRIPQATQQGYAEVPVGGVFDASYPNSKTRRGRVQENGEISPTLTTNSEDAILRYEGAIPCASRKRGNEHKIETRKDKVANCVTSIDTDSMVAVLTPVRTDEGKRLRREGAETFGHKKLQPREDGISNTLTTVQKDNLVQEKSTTTPQGTEYKGKFIKEGDGLYTDTSQDFFRGGLDGVSRTLKAETHDAGCCVKDGYAYRIRKYTPREAFRIMDVSDADIDRIQAAGICKTAQYKLAGNSIVVACLYHIFKELFITKTKPIQATLF